VLSKQEESTLRKEIEMLKAWKESSLAVESSWDVQAVAQEMGLPLGWPIHSQILPYIQRIRAENDKLKSLIGGAREAIELYAIERPDRSLWLADWLKRATEAVK
jgi:hypothetical protein